MSTSAIENLSGELPELLDRLRRPSNLERLRDEVRFQRKEHTYAVLSERMPRIVSGEHPQYKGSAAASITIQNIYDFINTKSPHTPNDKSLLLFHLYCMSASDNYAAAFDKLNSAIIHGRSLLEYFYGRVSLSDADTLEDVLVSLDGKEYLYNAEMVIMPPDQNPDRGSAGTTTAGVAFEVNDLFAVRKFLDGERHEAIMLRCLKFKRPKGENFLRTFEFNVDYIDRVGKEPNPVHKQRLLWDFNLDLQLGYLLPIVIGESCIIPRKSYKWGWPSVIGAAIQEGECYRLFDLNGKKFVPRDMRGSISLESMTFSEAQEVNVYEFENVHRERHPWLEDAISFISENNFDVE